MPCKGRRNKIIKRILQNFNDLNTNDKMKLLKLIITKFNFNRNIDIDNIIVEKILYEKLLELSIPELKMTLNLINMLNNKD